MDLQADENSPMEGIEDNILLERAIETLKDQQQRILKLRFNEGKTQTEIAETIGVSQMHVSRLLRRALDDLRRQLDDMGGEEADGQASEQPGGARARTGS